MKRLLRVGDVFQFAAARGRCQWTSSKGRNWVVIKARMAGGGCGMGPGDVYPDGWHVTARRLRKDGSYNPRGVTTEFYQSGCFSGMVEPGEVKWVRKMRPVFA